MWLDLTEDDPSNIKFIMLEKETTDELSSNTGLAKYLKAMEEVLTEVGFNKHLEMEQVKTSQGDISSDVYCDYFLSFFLSQKC